MSNVFSRIFGTDKAIDHVLHKDNGLLARFGGWANDLHYSDAEKAKSNERVREWSVRYLEAMTPFKLAQRVLVFFAAGVWGFLILNIVIAIWLGNEAVLTQLITLMLSPYVSGPAISAFALYFTGGVVDAARRPADKI